MSRLLSLNSSMVLSGVMWLAAGTGLTDDRAELEQSWRSRLGEQKSVVYRAVGTRTLHGDPKQDRPETKTECGMRVWIDCQQHKFRIDVRDKRSASVLICDGRSFHLCDLKMGGWEVTSAATLKSDSFGLQAYPFLVAHGIVPLPPFEVSRAAEPENIPRARQRQAARYREATFEFDGEPPESVTITHDSDGLVSRYVVKIDGKRRLEIDNTYRREQEADVLDGFKLIKYGPSGTVLSTLEGHIERVALDVPITAEMFAKPHASKELRMQLANVLDRTTKVADGMTVDQFAEAVQVAVGPAFQVRVDHEALAMLPQLADRGLRLDSGEAPLSELLFGDLRQDHLDFQFDPQGITIVPRHIAWQRADVVDYSAIEHGMTIDQLRDAIHHASTRADDWSDVGGPAWMQVDELQGQLSVYHAQSDHFQFERRLDGLKRKPEE